MIKNENQFFQLKRIVNFSLLIFCLFAFMSSSQAEGTRLLRQPTISASHIAFAYGGDLWLSDFDGNQLIRLTSTAAVEKDPHFSPDGKLIAFTSNRAGGDAVYTMSVNGGEATRLTWHPSASQVRGWTNDGERVLFASIRDAAPTRFDRLYTISKNGGPATLLSAQRATNGSYSADGESIIIDKVRRWDVEWRDYRGGQNTPLIILNLKDLSETLLPNESTTDILPLWVGEKIYFLSDRDWCQNIWSFTPKTGILNQLTNYTGTNVKHIAASGNNLVFERDGYLHLFDLSTNAIKQLAISVVGDFPWAETKWKEVSKRVRSASLSPTGKRAIMEARGEIFTIPVEFGDARNITQSSDAADRNPIWSPKGDKLAWFSDANGNGYALMISSQDGLSEPRSISIGESKMAWEPVWSPDGKYIAFVDDDVRTRIVNLEASTIITAEVGGNNLERGNVGLSWSGDSRWLAYTKTAANSFRQIFVWSQKDRVSKQLTNSFADAFSPTWDRDGKHFYFLASTDVALGTGWANTSAMTSNPVYAAYIINLQKDDSSPFKPKSDEEKAIKEEDETKDSSKKAKKKSSKKSDKDAKADKPKEEKEVKIDFEGIDRRTMALSLPSRNYGFIIAGESGTAFIAERKPNTRSYTLQKYSLKEQEAKEFTSGVRSVSVSADGKKMLARVGASWKIFDTNKSNGKSAESLKVSLNMNLDYKAEWNQMFEEAWRYERDYFYDPNMHGRDWKVVYERYAPLIPFVKHRSDLNYILDQVNGELSVGHSFVRGGDFPSVGRSVVGLLGADFVPDNGRWMIKRIYTTESWNPGLTGPLDQAGMKIKEGYYIVGVNGKELTANDNPFRFFDGTLGKQTVLHINKTAEFKDSWKEIVKPIRSENGLRQRTWVEDNRRLVDKLSNGRLAYVWVPNTGGGGFVSFNRYFFAQQDKEGAVIDERFNGGGSLDDYMVDLMTRSLRAALTNEVPNGKPLQLPAGILGPKVLLINELAGSGGDFFPWIFRQQKVGPLIGMKTWGGLVKSSTHYALIDGGSLTAPDNAVFDPINNKWVAENEGIAPDIEVRQDAKSLSMGLDPQLERAVKELMKMLNKDGKTEITPPPFPTPAIKK